MEEVVKVVEKFYIGLSSGLRQQGDGREESETDGLKDPTVTTHEVKNSLKMTSKSKTKRYYDLTNDVTKSDV